MTDEIKYIDIAEFSRLGFLQEVNRLFFHPLGLALEVVGEADGRSSRRMRRTLLPVPTRYLRRTRSAWTGAATTTACRAAGHEIYIPSFVFAARRIAGTSSSRDHDLLPRRPRRPA